MSKLDSEGRSSKNFSLPEASRTTLAGALAQRISMEQAKPDLWKLAVFLRVGPAGADGRFVRDHCLARRATSARAMKWHNRLRHEAAQDEKNNQVPVCRRSREEAWRQHAVDLQKQYGDKLPPYLKVNHADLVLAHGKDGCVPAVVLSIWRQQKKIKLFPAEISRGNVHAVRLALMQEQDDGRWLASTKSPCAVWPEELLSLKLQASEVTAGCDGFRCTFTKESYEAIKVMRQEASALKGAPQVKRRKAATIEPIVANCRRNQKGRKLVAQEFGKLLDLDASRFPEKPLVRETDGVVRCRAHAEKPVNRDAFLNKSGWFMQQYFVLTKNPVQYGVKASRLNKEPYMPSFNKKKGREGERGRERERDGDSMPADPWARSSSSWASAARRWRNLHRGEPS